MVKVVGGLIVGIIAVEAFESGLKAKALEPHTHGDNHSPVGQQTRQVFELSTSASSKAGNLSGYRTQPGFVRPATGILKLSD